jgi:hypothetical protein
MEERMIAYFPDWWTFPLWASFRGWYRATDPVREQEFADRCAAGITREYMYKTFVKASPDRVWVVQSDLDKFHKYLAESDTP